MTPRALFRSFVSGAAGVVCACVVAHLVTARNDRRADQRTDRLPDWRDEGYGTWRP